jgi:uncharacterized FlaG/YvyC family protein
MVLKGRNRNKNYCQEEEEETRASAISQEQLNSKIDNITKDLDKAWSKNLRNGLSIENSDTICNYIIDMKAKINPNIA